MEARTASSTEAVEPSAQPREIRDFASVTFLRVRTPSLSEEPMTLLIAFPFRETRARVWFGAIFSLKPSLNTAGV